jgi:hypothetical protein
VAEDSTADQRGPPPAIQGINDEEDEGHEGVDLTHGKRKEASLRGKGLSIMGLLFLVSVAIAEPPRGLENRLVFALEWPWSYDQLLTFLAKHAGLELAVSPGALTVLATNRPKICDWTGRFHDVEVRYPLSWTLHFAGTKGACGE